MIPMRHTPRYVRIFMLSPCIPVSCYMPIPVPSYCIDRCRTYLVAMQHDLVLQPELVQLICKYATHLRRVAEHKLLQANKGRHD